LKIKEIDIYTDGACSKNPGKGGYGAILLYGNHRKEISGYSEHTTNNIMELEAVIAAIKTLKEKCKIKLYSDSEYVIKGMSERIEGWIINNWKTKAKTEVKNIEQWKTLYDLSKKHQIEWIWVKGHSSNEFNEYCDKLARNEITKIR